MRGEPGSPDASGDFAAALLAIAEAADLVELAARALPLEVAGPTDAAATLDLWAPAAAELAMLAARRDVEPSARQDVAALARRAAMLTPALGALRLAAGQ